MPTSINRVASGDNVAQGMHAVSAFLADRDVRGAGVFDQDLMQMVLVGERADRGGVTDDHLPVFAVGPTVADVVDHRPPDFLQ